MDSKDDSPMRTGTINKTTTGVTGVLLAAIGFSAQAKSCEQEVLGHYADLAQARFEDSLTTAISLQQAVDTMVAFMQTLTDKRYEHLLKGAK